MGICDIQRELLKDTVSPEHALFIAKKIIRSIFNPDAIESNPSSLIPSGLKHKISKISK